jgi:hypothetical protein
VKPLASAFIGGVFPGLPMSIDLGIAGKCGIDKSPSGRWFAWTGNLFLFHDRFFLSCRTLDPS